MLHGVSPTCSAGDSRLLHSLRRHDDAEQRRAREAMPVQLGDDTLMRLLVVLEVLVIERLERRTRPPLAVPGCGRRRTCSKIRGFRKPTKAQLGFLFLSSTVY
jgi:hypothetical protein